MIQLAAPSLLPPGFDHRKLLDMLPDHTWRLDPDYVCFRCRQPAYRHPFVEFIWGCRNADCSHNVGEEPKGMRTASIGVYFRERLPDDPAIESLNPTFVDTKFAAIIFHNGEVAPSLYAPA